MHKSAVWVCAPDIAFCESSALSEFRQFNPFIRPEQIHSPILRLENPAAPRVTVYIPFEIMTNELSFMYFVFQSSQTFEKNPDPFEVVKRPIHQFRLIDTRLELINPRTVRGL
jgi:hypothetical protein